MKVNCPTCQVQVTWHTANPFRPFCSKRCQLIDLGEWSEEKHSIPERPSETHAQHIDPEDIEAMLAEQNPDFFNN